MTRSHLVPLAALLAAACGGPQELDQPAPPPKPQPVEKIEPMTLPVSGQVDVVTVKDGAAEVPGGFSGVSGELTVANPSTWASVDGSITVSLGSWDSGLELRDQRVKDTFFQVAEHADATLTIQEFSGFGTLAVGGESSGTVKGQLALHGATQPVEVKATIARSAESSFQVSLNEPLTLHISEFGYADQLAALITECGHQSVADEVRVGVSLNLGDPPAPPPEAPPAEDAAPAGDPPVGGGE